MSNIVSLGDRVAAVERTLSSMERRFDEMQILVRGGKSSLKTLTVIERDEKLRASKVSIDDRELFAVENTVLTRAEKDALENQVRTLHQAFREVVKAFDSIVAFSQSAMRQARAADAVSVQSIEVLAILCNAIGLSLDLTDGKVTLSSISSEARSISLALEVDRLRADLSADLKMQTGQLRGDIKELRERANGTGG
jgi:hypothetical protein